MAHDIGQMFYHGEEPWHGLGKQIAAPATVEEALKLGELDWTVSLVPIVPAGEESSTIQTRVAVVRDDQKPGDPNRVVGVVHPGFRPLQNREGAELFDSLLGRGRRVYHTGGYLRHGEKIWLLARLPTEILVGGDDPVAPYLLFANSHDGSIGIDIRLTTVRVVCRNTLSMALKGNAAGKVFRRAHRLGTRQLKDEAAEFFQFSLKQCEEAQALFNRLAKYPFEAAAFQSFLQKLLPDPPRPVTQSASVTKGYETRLQHVRQDRSDLERVFVSGIPERQLAPVGENLWGAVNAVTAWVDHLQEIDGDRYAHAMFGGGDALKTRALTQAIEHCPG